MRKFALLWVCAATAVSCQAEASTLIDRGSYSADVSTGLDWLKLSVLNGLSYQAVEAGALGYTQNGWRFATMAEIDRLFRSNIPDIGPRLVVNPYYQVWTEQSFDNAYDLVLKLGMNVAFGDDRAAYNITDNDPPLHQVSVQGYFNDQTPGRHGLAEVTALFASAGEYPSQGRWGYSPDWLNDAPGPHLSSFLVRQAPIPEPTTWALSIVGFGLAAVALRRRSTYCTA